MLSDFARLLNRFGHNFNCYIFEFIGTFFLILTISLVGTVPAEESNSPSVLPAMTIGPLAIGGVLIALVYAGGSKSGAMYNPAVVLAVLLSGRNQISLRRATGYVVMQMTAAFLAASTGYAITDSSTPPNVQPGPGVSDAQAILAEALFTFVLATVVLNCATTKDAKGNSFFGLAIGFSVIVAAVAIGPISGAALNPALLALNCLHHAHTSDGWGSSYIYLVAPCLGGALAAFVFRLTNPEEYDGEFGADDERRMATPLRENDSANGYEAM